ncbi:hypothetical protein CHUAL_012790 [Chamberlinius hualienensis]
MAAIKLQAEQLQYIDNNQLAIYFEDAVGLLLQTKDVNPHLNVTKHFQVYFQQMSKGTHILHREYAFVKATDYNRKCFAAQVQKLFVGFNENETLQLQEYHAVLELICPDFPRDFITKLSKQDTAMKPTAFVKLFQDLFTEA